MIVNVREEPEVRDEERTSWEQYVSVKRARQTNTVDL